MRTSEILGGLMKGDVLTAWFPVAGAFEAGRVYSFEVLNVGTPYKSYGFNGGSTRKCGVDLVELHGGLPSSLLHTIHFKIDDEWPQNWAVGSMLPPHKKPAVQESTASQIQRLTSDVEQLKKEVAALTRRKGKKTK